MSQISIFGVSVVSKTLRLGPKSQHEILGMLDSSPEGQRHTPGVVFYARRDQLHDPETLPAIAGVSGACLGSGARQTEAEQPLDGDERASRVRDLGETCPHFS